jgi:hypothetical protein
MPTRLALSTYQCAACFFDLNTATFSNCPARTLIFNFQLATSSVHRCVPRVLGLGRSVSLAAVLEPVADLNGRQSSGGRQFPLVSRRRIRIVFVRVAKYATRSVLETIRRFFAVPYRAWQWELPPYAVLADCAQRPTARLFRFRVVGLEPE